MMLENNMEEEADGGVDKTRLGMNGSLLSWGLILLFLSILHTSFIQIKFTLYKIHPFEVNK